MVSKANENGSPPMSIIFRVIAIRVKTDRNKKRGSSEDFTSI